MNICVYGASSDNINKAFIDAGEKLGCEMAKRNIGLVFGGGARGMMGAVARGVYSKAGYIIGVAPSFFNVDGILFENCNEMIHTDTMRQRKQIMEDKSDAFIMSPGGIGTFEEFFEILTLKQLGQLTKAIVILNTDGYYDEMLAMMKASIEKNFIYKKVEELYFVGDDIDEILNYIEGYEQTKINAKDYKNV